MAMQAQGGAFWEGSQRGVSGNVGFVTRARFVYSYLRASWGDVGWPKGGGVWGCEGGRRGGWDARDA